MQWGAGRTSADGPDLLRTNHAGAVGRFHSFPGRCIEPPRFLVRRLPDMTAPLASWNDTPTKTAIVDFVQRTTTEGSADYLAPNDRIAVFDNDGTLWTEQPAYNQLLFAID